MIEPQTKKHNKTLVVYLELEPLQRWYTMRIDAAIIDEFKDLFAKVTDAHGANIEFKDASEHPLI
jgi:hypothetical protein